MDFDHIWAKEVISINIILRIVLSLLIIAGVGATGFVGTKAFLSDHAILSANTFSTGTADLLVCSGQTCSDYLESHVGFTSPILPGETKTNYIRLKNNSGEVDFAIAAQASTLGGDINSDDVTVTFTPVNSSEIPIGAPVSHSLTAWNTTPASLGIPNIVDGTTQEYKMDVSLASTVISTGTATFDFTFTGTQTP